jgi:hypothetical protein
LGDRQQPYAAGLYRLHSTLKRHSSFPKAVVGVWGVTERLWESPHNRSAAPHSPFSALRHVPLFLDAENAPVKIAMVKVNENVG